MSVDCEVCESVQSVVCVETIEAFSPNSCGLLEQLVDDTIRCGG